PAPEAPKDQTSKDDQEDRQTQCPQKRNGTLSLFSALAILVGIPLRGCRCGLRLGGDIIGNRGLGSNREFVFILLNCAGFSPGGRQTRHLSLSNCILGQSDALGCAS